MINTAINSRPLEASFKAVILLYNNVNSRNVIKFVLINQKYINVHVQWTCHVLLLFSFCVKCTLLVWRSFSVNRQRAITFQIPFIRYADKEPQHVRTSYRTFNTFSYELFTFFRWFLAHSHSKKQFSKEMTSCNFDKHFDNSRLG